MRIRVINIYASGAINGATKSFEIPHPDPNKSNMRLRHWCMESDIPGGSVIYKRQITSTKAQTIIFTMPSWFKFLTKNVIIFCSPYEHFGNAWGKYIDNNIIEIHTNKDGKYNIMILADRNDKSAKMCEKEIEYIPKSVEQTNHHPK